MCRKTDDVLDPSVRDSLYALVGAQGLDAAALALGVGIDTIQRALAARPILAASRAAIEYGLRLLGAGRHHAD